MTPVRACAVKTEARVSAVLACSASVLKDSLDFIVRVRIFLFCTTFNKSRIHEHIAKLTGESNQKLAGSYFAEKFFCILLNACVCIYRAAT